MGGKLTTRGQKAFYVCLVCSKEQAIFSDLDEIETAQTAAVPLDTTNQMPSLDDLSGLFQEAICADCLKRIESRVVGQVQATQDLVESYRELHRLVVMYTEAFAARTGLLLRGFVDHFGIEECRLVAEGVYAKTMGLPEFSDQSKRTPLVERYFTFAADELIESVRSKLRQDQSIRQVLTNAQRTVSPLKHRILDLVNKSSCVCYEQLVGGQSSITPEDLDQIPFTPFYKVTVVSKYQIESSVSAIDLSQWPVFDVPVLLQQLKQVILTMSKSGLMDIRDGF